MCSPNVLIGGVFLIGLVWRRRVIPVRPLLTASLDEEGCVEHEEYLKSLLNGDDEGDEIQNGSSHQQNGNGTPTTDPFMRSRQKKRERERAEANRKQKTLLTIRNMLGVITLASLYVFDWRSSLVLSQSILLLFFTFGTQSSLLVWAYTRSKVESDILEPEKQRSGMIWRGLLMTATLVIVVDAMSMASWVVFPTFISAERVTLPLGLIPVCIFMLIRIAVNLLALVISSKILHDIGEVGGGIYTQIFSIVINCSKTIGDYGVSSLQVRPLWTAFEGRGITLGRHERRQS